MPSKKTNKFRANLTLDNAVGVLWRTRPPKPEPRKRPGKPSRYSPLTSSQIESLKELEREERLKQEAKDRMREWIGEI